MSNKLLVAVLIVSVLSLTVSVIALNNVSDALGVTAGTEHYFPETFHEDVDFNDVFNVDGAATLTSTLTVSGETNLDTLVQGGDVTTLATSTAETLTAAQVCDSRVVVHDPDYGNFASSSAIVNLPDAGDLFSDCLDTNGDSISFWFVNPDAATASTTAITAGASTTLVGYDADQDQINGGNKAFLELARRSATELIVSVIELIDAD